MAKQESAFDLKHIEETAAVETSGILDELNLPPALVEFLRKNQRTIWMVVGGIALVVTVVSLYGSYRSYTLNKAAEAYDQALLLEGEAKVAALNSVAEKFASTPTATWSRIEIAHIDQDAGKLDAAIEKITAVNTGLKKDDLLKPLLLVNLGGLYEQGKKFDLAASVYKELELFKGFEAQAVSSLGRVYETKGETDKARQMFQRYLALTTDEGGLPQKNNPVRTMVQASLSRLQK